jgi:hypothetical protein
VPRDDALFGCIAKTVDNGLSTVDQQSAFQMYDFRLQILKHSAIIQFIHSTITNNKARILLHLFQLAENGNERLPRGGE